MLYRKNERKNDLSRKVAKKIELTHLINELHLVEAQTADGKKVNLYVKNIKDETIIKTWSLPKSMTFTEAIKYIEAL